MLQTQRAYNLIYTVPATNQDRGMTLKHKDYICCKRWLNLASHCSLPTTHGIFSKLSLFLTVYEKKTNLEETNVLFITPQTLFQGLFLFQHIYHVHPSNRNDMQDLRTAGVSTACALQVSNDIPVSLKSTRYPPHQKSLRETSLINNFG